MCLAVPGVTVLFIINSDFGTTFETSFDAATTKLRSIPASLFGVGTQMKTPEHSARSE